MDNLAATFSIANSALKAQSQRIRTATENLANANSTGKTPGANPYTRKVITFESQLDDTTGASLVAANGEELDTSPYRIEKIPAIRPLTKMATSNCRTSICSSNWPISAKAPGRMTQVFKL